jgi:UDP-4-amino-4,6-dideoxy-N-acetyl-beta-L-altrosamine transaminase
MERLAITGGKPVRAEMLPYGHQWIDGEDIKAVTETLQGDWITQGPKVEEFEKKVAEYCGAKYAVAVSSGTAALHAACAVAGISPGDEAVTTPLTFAATANAVIYCGGRPVLADIKPDTLNIDPDEVRRRLSPRTRVILPVDFAGHPADLEEIMAIAREKNLVVIEDAAHALGAEYKGRKIGSLADMTTLSFHPVKHITTGEGGMVLTNNKDYYNRLKIFRNHGLSKYNPEVGPWYSVIDSPGYNLRLTDFQCALGLSQMKKLERFIRRRREIAARYNQAFSGMPEIITPVEKGNARAVYHIYVIQLRPETLKAGRREIYEALRAENIGVNVHYIPLNLHPFYQQKFSFKKGDCPVAESYYEKAITLPIFPKMSDSDTQDVIKAVKKVLAYYSRGDTEV